MARVTGRQALAAAAAGAVIALAAHHGQAAGAASGAPLSCQHLEALWTSAGGSAGTALMAAEIATAESGGRQDATDPDSNGTVDRGLWQINSVHGALSTYNPAGNARAAVLLSSDGTDWSPWVTYATGAYQGRC
jgi:hypothetical protein